MSIQKKKFELSPRLKLGVGRGHSNQILKFSAIICLILAVGLAINAFRLVFQSNNSANNSAPQVLGATDIKTPGNPQNKELQVIEYKVAKGDTLFNISQKFNISWTTLATLNNLKSPFALKPGQTLQIPKP